jgi:hypothetical protein
MAFINEGPETDARNCVNCYPQNSRPYFTVSSETPPTWRARFPYLYPPGTGWSVIPPGTVFPFQVKVKVTLRLTVSQSVCLGVKPKSGTFDQRFFCSKLLSCLFGAPSLTRGRVCHVSIFVIEVYHSLVY